MADEPKPFTPHVAFAMDDMRERAKRARADAHILNKQAEIWEAAADVLEVAITREKRQAPSAQQQKGGEP